MLPARHWCDAPVVRPILEYASSVWDLWTKTKTDKIEAIQRRLARFVRNDYSTYSSVNQMLESLKWDTLCERRARAKVIIMCRIMKEQIAIPKELLKIATQPEAEGTIRDCWCRIQEQKFTCTHSSQTLYLYGTTSPRNLLKLQVWRVLGIG